MSISARIGAVLLFFLAALCFEPTATILTAGAATAILYRMIVKRDRRVWLAVTTSVVCFLAFEWIGGYVLKVAAAESMNVDVDHRMKPNSAEIGTNGDGIRCRYEADDYHDDSFNIIFLGDSFTYGVLIEDVDDTFVAQVESRLNEAVAANRDTGPKIRTINFGWATSSPLLSYRLLRDIGRRYSPDLVVMCLDMSDFHDDMRYRAAAGFESPSPTRYLALRLGCQAVLGELEQNWRFTGLLNDMSDRVPRDSFFIVNQPLEQSLALMQDTETNLVRIAELSRQRLHSEFAVVMFPRAFQYSQRESPNNWQAWRYQKLGPCVLEPFRWLEGFAARVDFPCISLLAAFSESAEFPLYFDDDIHWNAAGHRVAADAIASELVTAGMIPGVAGRLPPSARMERTSRPARSPSTEPSR